VAHLVAGDIEDHAFRLAQGNHAEPIQSCYEMFLKPKAAHRRYDSA
jgi:hypothetical protein